MLDFPVGRALKRLFDANEFPWLLPLPPWADARERQVRRIRRAAQAVLRRRAVAARGWLPVLASAAVWPALSLLKAAFDARSPGRLHRSLTLAVLDAWWLQLAHNLRLADQRYFRLDRPAHRRAVRLFVADGENKTLLEEINRSTASRTIGDKRAFAAFCAQHDLPTVPLLATGADATVEHLAPWPASDLFLKPAALWGGLGAQILRHDAGRGTWTADSGAAVTPESIGAFTRAVYGPTPWLLQPRLANSPALAPFAPPGAALATIRVVTGRLLPTGPVAVVAGFMRFPLRASTVDNLCAGGIGADYEPATGTLRSARSLAPGAPRLSHHPNTGAPLEGAPVPCWSAVAALASRAHEPITDLATIGWDIALAPAGPVLIEANPNWGVPLDTPLGATAYLGFLLQPTQAQFFG